MEIFDQLEQLPKKKKQNRQNLDLDFGHYDEMKRIQIKGRSLY